MELRGTVLRTAGAFPKEFGNRQQRVRRLPTEEGAAAREGHVPSRRLPTENGAGRRLLLPGCGRLSEDCLWGEGVA